MQALFDRLARFLPPPIVVGGHALDVHGVTRQTLDIDCLIAAEHGDAFDAYMNEAGFLRVAKTSLFARYRHVSSRLPEVDVLFTDGATFSKLAREAVPFPGSNALKVPSLPHLIALKLHAIRNAPEREARDLGDIVALLRANAGVLSTTELRELCTRFGPNGIETRLGALLPL